MFAVTVYFGHYFAAAHYDYAVGHAEDLRHFRRYHDNALALLDKAVHYVVNLDLCADVDTTGRFVKDKDLCNVIAFKGGTSLMFFRLYRYCPWIAHTKTVSQISSCNGTLFKIIV